MHTRSSGLLAPQFGSSRNDAHELHLFFEPELKAPTVVVRRRRTLEVAQTLDVEVVHTLAVKEPYIAPVRPSKTFRLGPPAAGGAVALNSDLARSEVGDVPDAAPTGLANHEARGELTDSVAPPALKRLPRRRRSEVEKPTLIQHLVFEHAPAEPAAPTFVETSLSPATQASDALVTASSGYLEPWKEHHSIYPQVLEALDHLKATVAYGEQAQAWSRSFDLLMGKPSEQADASIFEPVPDLLIAPDTFVG